MKQLIGKDIGSYAFDKTAKTITFSGVTITQEQILLVTNTTSQIIIYSFADSSIGGSLTGSVLTLTYDTSGMSNTDKLQIYIDIPDVVQDVSDANVLTQLQTLNTNDATFMLRNLVSVMSDPVYLNKTSNALNALLLSGSTTAVTGTLTGVTTVTTVTGLTNIGGKGADMVTDHLSSIAWNNLRNLYV